jgi:hypothetical protein
LAVLQWACGLWATTTVLLAQRIAEKNKGRAAITVMIVAFEKQ